MDDVCDYQIYLIMYFVLLLYCLLWPGNAEIIRSYGVTNVASVENLKYSCIIFKNDKSDDIVVKIIIQLCHCNISIYG